MIRRTLLAITLFAPLIIAACTAGGDSDITVEEPFARETIGLGTTGAAFLVIRNSGPGEDRLIAASSPAAGNVEIHTHAMTEDGVMQMRRIDGIYIPANETVTLAPGDLHLMLFDLTAPLTAGGSFPLTLSFENSDDITVDVSVVSTGGRMHDSVSPEGAMDHGEMKSGDMGHDTH